MIHVTNFVVKVYKWSAHLIIVFQRILLLKLSGNKIFQNGQEMDLIAICQRPYFIRISVNAQKKIYIFY